MDILTRIFRKFLFVPSLATQWVTVLGHNAVPDLAFFPADMASKRSSMLSSTHCAKAILASSSLADINPFSRGFSWFIVFGCDWEDEVYWSMTICRGSFNLDAGENDDRKPDVIQVWQLMKFQPASVAKRYYSVTVSLGEKRYVTGLKSSICNAFFHIKIFTCRYFIRYWFSVSVICSNEKMSRLMIKCLAIPTAYPGSALWKNLWQKSALPLSPNRTFYPRRHGPPTSPHLDRISIETYSLGTCTATGSNSEIYYSNVP